MKRFLFDTNVFLYAVGSDHPYRAPCQKIVALQGERRLSGEGSMEMVQEFLHFSIRRRKVSEATELAHQVAAACAKLHDFTAKDLERALALLNETSEIRPRDAVLAATAINRSIEYVLSADRHFDLIEGITRIDPSDLTTVIWFRNSGPVFLKIAECALADPRSPP